MKETIKEYFSNEVSKVKTPPMPINRDIKRVKPWGNILLTAMAVTSLVIIYNPDSYNSRVRNLEISKILDDGFVDDLSRVVYEADHYFNIKRSQK